MTWSSPKVKGTPPGPRENHASVVIQDKMYVFGGWDAASIKETYNDVHTLDIASKTWEKVITQGMTPTPRAGMSGVADDSKAYYFGGVDKSGTFSDDLYMLDTRTNMWYKPSTAGSLPAVRADHTANLVGEKMYVFGGQSDAGEHADLWALDLNALTWVKPAVQGEKPAARSGHTASLVGAKIFVIGGIAGDTTRNDVEVFDTATSTWSKIAATGSPPEARQVRFCSVHGAACALRGWTSMSSPHPPPAARSL